MSLYIKTHNLNGFNWFFTYMVTVMAIRYWSVIMVFIPNDKHPKIAIKSKLGECKITFTRWKYTQQITLNNKATSIKYWLFPFTFIYLIIELTWSVLRFRLFIEHTHHVWYFVTLLYYYFSMAMMILKIYNINRYRSASSNKQNYGAKPKSYKLI